MMTLTGGRKTTINAAPASAHNAHLSWGFPGC
ncbi:hypothetical protein ABIC98_001944 [Arthrobacter nitrophenolicus]|jgi:hypothetical protein|uniref:Uncharacterized protein n=1 Tax=Arthrobacter nitrophenolicus TaxID=683150 RepID=A0ACC6TEX6_9MICC